MKRLKELLFRHGMNQRELADRIGYSQTLVSFIATGKRTPTKEQRKKIFKVFGQEENEKTER